MSRTSEQLDHADSGSPCHHITMTEEPVYLMAKGKPGRRVVGHVKTCYAPLPQHGDDRSRVCGKMHGGVVFHKGTRLDRAAFLAGWDRMMVVHPWPPFYLVKTEDGTMRPETDDGRQAAGPVLEPALPSGQDLAAGAGAAYTPEEESDPREDQA